jgi:Flp pilus assembly protein protease CpaA
MPDDSPAASDPAAPLRPWASLRFRDYSLLFTLALFAVSAQQMRLAQNLYQVYEISGSAFLLGMTGLAQGVPIFALGLFGGTLADFIDRKKILLITTFGNLLVAIALGVLTLTGLIQVCIFSPGQRPLRAQHRAQSNPHGIDIPPSAAIALNQRRGPQFQRFPGIALRRTHVGRAEPRVDEHGECVSVQRVVLHSGSHRCRSPQSS